MTVQYDYASVLAASERVSWSIDELINADKKLDFARPFLPESLARTEALTFLDARDRLLLNQIRGHAYLAIFGLVEEFILPFVIDHARPQLDGDDFRTRAYLGFASEEAKHIHLFKRFQDAFRRQSGLECAVIGPPAAVAGAVLAHGPLGVALTILHIEWMTQRHYVDSVRDNADLDPMFKELLRSHWMEEAQHAKLDTNMVLELAAGTEADGVAAGVRDYLAIGGILDEGLKQQTAFDLQAFERARGRALDSAEREAFVAVQHQANRWTYLGTGMTHAQFLKTLGVLGAEARASVEAVSPIFC